MSSEPNPVIKILNDRERYRVIQLIPTSIGKSEPLLEERDAIELARITSMGHNDRPSSIQMVNHPITGDTPVIWIDGVRYLKGY